MRQLSGGISEYIDAMEKFGFERLDVYQCALEFLELAYLLIDQLPKGYAPLADQLRRSSLSIPLNIAEGTGKSSTSDRRRFYQIARGSALECSAIIGCCLKLRLVDQQSLEILRSLLVRIVQMLSKMAIR